MGPSPRFPESKDGTWNTVAFSDVNFVNADNMLTISHFNMWTVFLSKRESGSSLDALVREGTGANGEGGEGRFLLFSKHHSLYYAPFNKVYMHLHISIYAH